MKKGKRIEAVEGILKILGVGIEEIKKLGEKSTREMVLVKLGSEEQRREVR